MSCVDVDFSVIGMHIRTFRKIREMTQEELAERAGISIQFLSVLERGKGVPSVPTLLSLCSALNVTPNDLLRCCAAYNPDAPCTLRDDHTVFTDTLDAALFPQECSVRYISLDALPDYDLTLPDTDFDP